MQDQVFVLLDTFSSMGLFNKQNTLSSTKCKKCGTELFDSERLKRHIEKAHGKIKIKCKKCGTEFISSDELRKHKKKCK